MSPRMYQYLCRPWRLLVRVLLLCAVANGAWAAQALPFTLVQPIAQLAPMALAPAEQQWLQKHQQTLRIGMSINDNEPLDIAVDRNRYQGVSADYLNLIRARLGVTLQIHGFTRRDDAIEALHQGDIDVLTASNSYEQGFAGLAFTSPYLFDRPVLARRSDDIRQSGDGLDDQRVAVVEGYASVDAVQRAYPSSRVVVAPSLSSALEALRQGAVDAVIGNEIILRSYMALRPYVELRITGDSRLSSSGFAFAIRNTDAPLTAMFDRALGSLQGALQREILGRWTSGLGAGIAQRPVQLDSDEQSWIAAHPKVQVAATEYAPYLYRDRQGRWVGLNVDILAALSQMTGLQFEYVHASSIAQSLDLLKSGRAQMNTTLSETSERRSLLEFTHSYGGQSWVFILRRDGVAFDSLEEMDDRVLALPAQHALEDFIRREYPQIRLKQVATMDQARDAVARGQADATIDSEVGAYRAVQRESDNGLTVGRSLDGAWSPDRFSVTLANPQLTSILNKALEAFPVADLRAIRLKWLGAALPEVPVWQRIAPWVYWGAAVAGLIALISLLWSGRLRVQIAQRQRAEEALSDQLVFQKALLDGIPNPIYVRDLEGRLLSCNRSYEECFATRFERIKGLQLPEVGLIGAEDAQRVHADYLKQLENPKPVFIDRQIELGGKRIDAYQWTVPFYRADGQLQGLLGGWIDITERKRLEVALTEARQAAEDANLAKSSFLATMSHDIRTPLSAIIGLLELERDTSRARGQTLSQGLEVAFRCACELLELVGDSLDLSRIEAGRLELHLTPVALSPFFADIARLFEPEARRKGLDLQVQIALGLQGQYWIDALRLRQVMHNLLGNALKFTHRGRVSLVVNAHLEGALLALDIRVEDTGIGIDAAQQAQLFEPYVQVGADAAQLYGGSGLGLSICQRLIALMAGQMQLRSTPGQGTCISLQLQVHQVEVISIKEPPELTSAVSADLVPRMLHVLIADDLSSNRLVLSRQLEYLGHQVEAVAGGEDALIAWQDGDFDVLISDCNMPGISGYELATRIRELEIEQELAPTPIIGYTANVMNDERQRCEEAGMDLWLPKPLSLDALSQALTQLTRPRHFDPATLQALTHANAQLLQRMLSELDSNLEEELERLHDAVEALDWPMLEGVLHRLKGVCAMIDAGPLAKACGQFGKGCSARHEQQVRQDWPTFRAAIEDLQADILRTLRGMVADE
ncbi:transporter substrate-binding domain-containing protein [Pseudomonas sp. MWU16-30317]|uniref:transporter substrate-binding domain-containing protein n=1 Tax=Pseudomonas sp. MWU16-30317 TaxID=2878095 RepID=UPI001CFA011E|nr:transporter substrate-binding domain-containing protein [Pseudomonas sp. MWU16-30317]